MIQFIDSFYEKIIRKNEWEFSSDSCKDGRKFIICIYDI
jgi:hypothetical protein